MTENCSCSSKLYASYCFIKRDISTLSTELDK